MTESNAGEAQQEHGGRVRSRSLSSDLFCRQPSPTPPNSLPSSPRDTPVPETKDCTVCAASKEMAEFPDEQISELCLHLPGVCSACLQTSIQVDFRSKRWDQIHCPECPALLDYHHVRKYADEDTFAR